MDSGRTTTQIERNHKANIRARALAHLPSKCVNAPKVRDLKVNGFQILYIDDLGRGHSTFKDVTFTVEDTFRLNGIMYIYIATGLYDGTGLTISDWYEVSI